jgi:alpha-D-ribose 1-methylphosphonate 5-phosphate C-P lyase
MVIDQQRDPQIPRSAFRAPRLSALAGAPEAYNYAFLDEVSKREIRRALLKAVAIPGYQVPFGSREMPIARGWGSGGLQVTLATLGRATP